MVTPPFHRLIPTIYPNGRHITKQCKMHAISAFSGIFAQIAKRETVNFDIKNALICRLFASKKGSAPALCEALKIIFSPPGFFFDYSEEDIGGWKYQILFMARINKLISYESNAEIISL